MHIFIAICVCCARFKAAISLIISAIVSCFATVQAVRCVLVCSPILEDGDQVLNALSTLTSTMVKEDDMERVIQGSPQKCEVAWWFIKHLCRGLR